MGLPVDVDFPVDVVEGGEVGAEVDAAGFGAEVGSAADQRGDFEHVLKFPAGGAVEGLVEDVAGPEVDDLRGLFKMRAVALDTDIAPHERAQAGADVGGVELGAGGGFDLDGELGGDEVFGFAGDELAGVFTGAFAEDEGFDEGIGGEAVGAVEAGVGDFADGVEVLDGGLAEEVGDDAADHVMRGWVDRDGLLRRIDVEGHAHVVDAGEAVAEGVFGHVAGIEKDMGELGFGHLCEHGAGDDIARREFGHGVIIGHEAVAVAVDELCAFSADGFRHQGSRGAGNVDGGGMELDHFHIAGDGAGAVGHGVAVGGGDGGVGGFAVEDACAAGGEDGFAGEDHEEAAAGAVFLPGDGADAAGFAFVDGDEVEDEGVFEDLDFVVCADLAGEGVGEFAAGGVAEGVDDAGGGVTAFAADGEAAIDFAVEVGAPFDEFLDAGGGFGDDGFDGGEVAEAAGDGHGVGDVGFEGIAGLSPAHDGGDAALGVEGVGFLEVRFREEEDFAVSAAIGRGEGCAEAADAATDHEAVGEDVG